MKEASVLKQTFKDRGRDVCGMGVVGSGVGCAFFAAESHLIFSVACHESLFVTFFLGSSWCAGTW